MAGLRGHAARAVRARAALPGEAHHPRAARGSVRLVARFRAHGSAGCARERPRSTRVCRRADAPRATGRAGAAHTDLVRAADGAVRLWLLRVGAGRDPLRAGRLSHVTGVERWAGAARGAGRHIRRAAVRRPTRRAARRPALAGGAPSPSRVRRAARPRRDHGAIPRQRLVPKATAEARTPEDHRHQHQSSKASLVSVLLKTAGYSRAREHRGPGHRQKMERRWRAPGC